MLELISVTTRDGLELDGALYQATTPRTSPKPAILIVHGLTWNFYRGPSRWLPPLLAEAGLDSLALNMRDHDRPEVQDFDLSHHDLRAGVDCLFEAGANEVVLFAHGYACNKVACYPRYSGDQRITRQVFATLGAVQSYAPHIWSKVLDAAADLRGRVLIVQGATDTLIDAQGRAEELRTAAGAAETEVVLLEGADHYFQDRHRELARRVVAWLGSDALGGRGLTQST